ncbi:sulfatase [Engelhardtia mirabilis]|uniref:Arylsulfatase n=1 Tax=Engelhardtia mirabilis TaxID=2528011 RepID=A0A518BDL2_9BACT|nr:Arylsulfatase precursor [Planctomycetes bacterium Pla133]QDU99403.1 Arylsulfatase precursor [Planctomycetes bacterium Pla86]
MKFTTPVALLLLAACGSNPQALGPEGTSQPNVILICWDTVRADRLTPYGYEKHPTTPFLSELAQKGLIFDDAWSTAGWTKPSVSSFMTGTLPAHHGVYDGSSKEAAGVVSDLLPDDSTTLAEVFEGAGYRTAGFVKNGHLRPGLGLEQGFDSYRDRVGDSRAIRWEALDWLDSLDGNEPFYLYLHTIDAHWPWEIPDEYAGRFTALADVRRFQARSSADLFDAVEDGELAWTTTDQDQLDSLYDGALRYQDDQLRLLFEGLEQRGLTDNLVFAFVSDHGEALGENGRFGHGYGLGQELLHVPFIISGPGIEARRSSAPVSLLDLFPTLIAAAGIDAPATHDGIDRLADPDSDRERVAEHKAPDRYLATLRRGDLAVELDWLAPAPDPGRIPFGPGDRVEAKFEPGPGTWIASEVDEGDDDVDDPAELKGPLDGIDDSWIGLGGRHYERAAEARLVFADGAEGLEPAVGSMVKLRMEGTPPVVTRIKLYPEGTEVEFELRGAVDEVEGGASTGRIRIAGEWIDLGPDSDVGGPAPRKLERAAFAQLLASGGEAAATQGFELERRGFRIEGSRRVGIAEIPLGLEQRLVGRLVDASAGRLWSADGAQAVLGSDDLDALRRLGYLR